MMQKNKSRVAAAGGQALRTICLEVVLTALAWHLLPNALTLRSQHLVVEASAIMGYKDRHSMSLAMLRNVLQDLVPDLPTSSRSDGQLGHSVSACSVPVL